jgi:hypothetical protein
MVVPIAQQTIASFNQNYSFTLPAGSVYLFQVPTAAWPAPGPSATGGSGLGYALLNWSAISGATGYDIYRSTTPTGFGSSPYVTNVSGTSFSDTSTTPGTTYYYRVTAITGGGQTDTSNLVSATPLAFRWSDGNFNSTSTTSDSLANAGWANYFSVNNVPPQSVVGNYYSLGYASTSGTPLVQLSLGTGSGNPGNFIQITSVYNYDLVLPLAPPPATETWTVSFDYKGNLSNTKFSVWTSAALTNLIYYWDGSYGNSGTNTNLTGDILLTNTGSTWTHFTTNVVVPAGAAKVSLSWGGDATGGGIDNISVTEAAPATESDTPTLPSWALAVMAVALFGLGLHFQGKSRPADFSQS